MVVDTHDATPSMHGGALRLYSIFQALADSGSLSQVDYFAISCPRGLPGRRELRSRGAARVGGSRDVGGAQALFADTLTSRRYDVVVFSYFFTATLLAGLTRSISPDTRLVLDTHDLSGLRVRRGMALGHQGPFGDTFEAEVQTLGLVDEIWVSSAADASDLQSAYGPVSCHVIPSAFESTWPGKPFPPARRRHYVLLGPSSHGPNADGAEWFLPTGVQELARDSDQVLLIGADQGGRFAALRQKGLTVKGHAPNAHRDVARAHCLIAPIRYGAGMCMKVGFAMGLGTPVVGTPLAFRGYTPAAPALQADSVAGLVEQALLLRQSPDIVRQITAAGREFIEDSYSNQTVEGHIGRRVQAWARDE